MQTRTTRQMRDADRDARLANHDQRVLDGTTPGDIQFGAPPRVNAMLNRDAVNANRASAALRRYAMSPAGRRRARAA